MEGEGVVVVRWDSTGDEGHYLTSLYAKYMLRAVDNDRTYRGELSSHARPGYTTHNEGRKWGEQGARGDYPSSDPPDPQPWYIGCDKVVVKHPRPRNEAFRNCFGRILECVFASGQKVPRRHLQVAGLDTSRKCWWKEGSDRLVGRESKLELKSLVIAVCHEGEFVRVECLPEEVDQDGYVRGMGLFEENKYEEAEREFAAALEDPGVDDILAIKILMYLKVVLAIRGELGKALERCKEVVTKTSVLDHRDAEMGELHMMAVSNLGEMYVELNDFASAKHFLLKGLSLSQRLGKVADEAKLFGGLGEICEEEKDLMTARCYYEKYFELSRQCQDLESISASCCCLERIYRKLLTTKDKLSRETCEMFAEKADHYGRKASELSKKVGDKLLEADVLLHSLSFREESLHDKIKQSEECVEMYRRMSADGKLSLSLDVLARLYREANLPEQAIASLEQSLLFSEKVQSTICSVEDSVRIAFFEQQQLTYQELIDVLASLGRDDQKMQQRALEIAERTKARTLTDFIASKHQIPCSASSNALDWGALVELVKKEGKHVIEFHVSPSGHLVSWMISPDGTVAHNLPSSSSYRDGPSLSFHFSS
eukprot:141801-Hanusia_phi.AAC.2